MRLSAHCSAPRNSLFRDFSKDLELSAELNLSGFHATFIRTVIRRVTVHDHLKDAADAADLTDEQLLAIRRRIGDPEHPTGFEQAVLDEMKRRNLRPS